MKGRESGDQQVTLSEVWKRKNQSALPNSVLQHDKTITIVSSVSIHRERSVCESNNLYVCLWDCIFDYFLRDLFDQVLETNTSNGAGLLVFVDFPTDHGQAWLNKLSYWYCVFVPHTSCRWEVKVDGKNTNHREFTTESAFWAPCMWLCLSNKSTLVKVVKKIVKKFLGCMVVQWLPLSPHSRGVWTSVWNLHVLPVPVWEFSGFPPTSKDMYTNWRL